MLNNLLEVPKQNVFRITKVIAGETKIYSGIFKSHLDARLDASKEATLSRPVKIGVKKIN